MISLFYNYIHNELDHHHSTIIHINSQDTMMNDTVLLWDKETAQRCEWLLIEYIQNRYSYDPSIRHSEADYEHSLERYRVLLQVYSLLVSLINRVKRIEFNKTSMIVNVFAFHSYRFIDFPSVFVYVTYCYALLHYLHAGIHAFLQSMEEALALLYDARGLPVSSFISLLFLAYKYYYLFSSPIQTSLPLQTYASTLSLSILHSTHCAWTLLFTPRSPPSAL